MHNPARHHKTMLLPKSYMIRTAIIFLLLFHSGSFVKLFWFSWSFLPFIFTNHIISYLTFGIIFLFTYLKTLKPKELCWSYISLSLRSYFNHMHLDCFQFWYFLKFFTVLDIATHQQLISWATVPYFCCNVYWSHSTASTIGENKTKQNKTEKNK